LGLMPKSRPRKVLASMTSDRYRPVGAFAPGGREASLAVKCPRIVIRNTLRRAEPGTESPGVAEVSALARVVTAAVIHAGLGSPLMVAARCAIAVSRGIAEAGTGAPAAAGVRPQPTAASMDASVAVPASAASARTDGRGGAVAGAWRLQSVYQLDGHHARAVACRAEMPVALAMGDEVSARPARLASAFASSSGFGIVFDRSNIGQANEILGSQVGSQR
jgi:hypothetical protein